MIFTSEETNVSILKEEKMYEFDLGMLRESHGVEILRQNDM